MPYNPAVAASVNGSPVNLGGTLNTIFGLDLMQARSGLYNLQALQQAREYNALQSAGAAMQSGTGNPAQVYISSGGQNPGYINALQNYGPTQTAISRAGGVLPNQALDLSKTNQTNAQTQNVNLELQSKIANGVITTGGRDDSAWTSAVNAHYQTFGGSDLERQHLLSIKDPQQRMQIAQAYSGQGMAPADVNKPMLVQTPGGAYYAKTGDVISGTVPGAPTAPPSPQPAQNPNAPRVGAPGTAVTAPQPGGLQGISPAAEAEQKAYGEFLGKEPDTLQKDAEAARNQNFVIDQMKMEAANWPWMGKGTDAAAKAAQYLKPIANSLGSHTFDNFVGNYEAFQKNAGVLVRQAVREVSSRAAVQEFNLIQKQLPSADMSAQGFGKIVDQLGAVNDYKVARQEAAQAWRDKYGTMDKFDANWNRNITPNAFLIARMSPQELIQLRDKLQASPEGRQIFNNLNSQIKYAHDNGLF